MDQRLISRRAGLADAVLSRWLAALRVQNGFVRSYALVVLLGVVAILTYLVFARTAAPIQGRGSHELFAHPAHILPLVGFLVIVLAETEAKAAIRWTALVTSLVTFGLSLWVLAQFNPPPGLQMEVNQPWIAGRRDCGSPSRWVWMA